MFPNSEASSFFSIQFSYEKKAGELRSEVNMFKREKSWSEKSQGKTHVGTKRLVFVRYHAILYFFVCAVNKAFCEITIKCFIEGNKNE